MVNWVYYEMGNLQEKHTVKVHCLSHPQSPQLSFTHNAFCSVYYKVFLSHFKFNFTGGTLFIQLFMVLQSGIQRASQKPISCFLGFFFFLNIPLTHLCPELDSYCENFKRSAASEIPESLYKEKTWIEILACFYLELF